MSTVPIQPDDGARSGDETTGRTVPLDLETPAFDLQTPAQEPSTTWASAGPEAALEPDPRPGAAVPPPLPPASVAQPTPPFQPAAPAPPVPPAPPAQPAQTWIEGPHWTAIIMGLACVAMGGIALWQLVSGQMIDWDRYGPVVLGVVGLVMVLAGTLGLIRRGRTAGKTRQHT